MTQCHPKSFFSAAAPSYRHLNWECVPASPSPMFTRLFLPWPLLDRITQQLPSDQTQLGWLKLTAVTFQKHIFSVMIYASHARNEGKKEIVICTLTQVTPADGQQQGQESQSQRGRKKVFHVTWCSHLVWLGVPLGCGSADPHFSFYK